MVIHEIWFGGADQSVVYKLESDELVQKFRLWVQGAKEAGTDRGFAFKYRYKQAVINFQLVARMEAFDEKDSPEQTTF